ncbi:hypothetical protein GIB67_007650 [Kingdonia uniflora]|uniref:Uncharacterized protein n=1 Tax=Kingdonia uniflora TaxID=39325 RepID=A0A7J7N1E0_9MAGN|nr:hypothetical protein GIB67_007650 [Kingdonia uniflora]
MLLFPQNSSEGLCRRLKLNIDDATPTKYFICFDFLRDGYKSHDHKGAFLSYSNNAHYGCRNPINNVVTLGNENVEDNADANRGVFIKGIKFMVTDDLQIMPISTETSFTHLRPLGIKGMDVVDEKIVSIDVKEILYTEGGEDFVDFLFSLLTFPLGSVVKLLNRTPSLGCISNMYKTVEGATLTKHVRADEKAALLSPMVSPPFGRKNQFLDIEIYQPKFGVIVELAMALRLLEASLTSKSTLSTAFINIDMKKPKQEK